jgi:hypothetical protein
MKQLILTATIILFSALTLWAHVQHPRHHHQQHHAHHHHPHHTGA